MAFYKTFYDNHKAPSQGNVSLPKVRNFVAGYASRFVEIFTDEFLPGARFYLGDRSPTEGERREYGYSKAWMHHKGRNKHHFEYWTDYNPKTRRMEAVEMPLKYVKEMFCDRVAAGKIYLDDKYTNDNPIEYFLKGNAKTSMHPNTAKLLEGWLMMLQQEGEEKTFAYIKNLK